MKTALLLRTILKREDGGIWVSNQWQGDNWLPIVISEREVLHEKCIVIPKKWRLRFVYTSYVPYRADRFYYGVRTDEYPLMWLWYWPKACDRTSGFLKSRIVRKWKIRFDKSLELFIMGLVLSLEVWGLAKVTPGAKPSLVDLKFHPVGWLKKRLRYIKLKVYLFVFQTLQCLNPPPQGFFQDGWYFRVARINKTGDWIAWCSKTPLIAKFPGLEPPGTEVWFEFGRTKEEALARLKADVYAF